MSEFEYSPEIPNTSIEVLERQEQYIGHTKVTSERIRIEGEESRVTTLHVSEDAQYALGYDATFTEKGIVTEPGRLLIDQNATRELHGHQAGTKPEVFLSSSAEGSIAIPGNHFGWQEGAFIVEGGQLRLIKNDEGNVSGDFDILARKDDEWKNITVSLVDGELTPESDLKIEGVQVGYSAPRIVRDKKIVSLREIIKDPRIKADVRNLVDLSAGESVPGIFFQDIRKMAPEEHGMYRLVREAPSSIVTRAPIPESEKEKEPYERLGEAISEGKLPHMKMDTKGGNYRLGIFGKMPEQKMPLMGYGILEDGSLMVVSIDGRQKDSTGVSIDQLARLLQEKGAKDAFLMCGGGDVSVVAKTEEEIRVLNSPSNKDEHGNQVTRNVPNVLIIS